MNFSVQKKRKKSRVVKDKNKGILTKMRDQVDLYL